MFGKCRRIVSFSICSMDRYTKSVPSFSICSRIAAATTSLGSSSSTNRSFFLLYSTAPSPRTDSEIKNRLPGFFEYSVVG